MKTAKKSKTDWNKEENRNFLYKALEKKLSIFASGREAANFLDVNGIEWWEYGSDFRPHDLKSMYASHVWISCPGCELKLAVTLFVPYDFAEKAVKALMLGGAENLP